MQLLGFDIVISQGEIVALTSSSFTAPAKEFPGCDCGRGRKKKDKTEGTNGFHPYNHVRQQKPFPIIFFFIKTNFLTRPKRCSIYCSQAVSIFKYFPVPTLNYYGHTFVSLICGSSDEVDGRFQLDMNFVFMNPLVDLWFSLYKIKRV